MMNRTKTHIVALLTMSVIIGLSMITGCGASAEEQKLTTIIQEYTQTVDAYEMAVENHDETKKAELAAKVKRYMTAWGETKNEMMDAVTPQVLDELDNTYQKITQKYVHLAKS
jgi:outer membrane murein-binding lipoprotein Lpp